MKNILTISERQFREQVDLLDDWGFSSMTFEDYRLAQQGELLLPKRPVIITFDGGCRDTYEVAFPILQKYGMRGVIFVNASPESMKNVPDSTGEQTHISKEHILEMHAEGFEIGAYPPSHADLTALPEKEAWEEISRSRMLLEIMLNAPVKSFSFPGGRLNDATKRMVADAGYTNACSASTGPATFFADPYEIRRTTVFGTMSKIGFTLRLMLPYERYKWFMWQLRKSRK